MSVNTDIKYNNGPFNYNCANNFNYKDTSSHSSSEDSNEEISIKESNKKTLNDATDEFIDSWIDKKFIELDKKNGLEPLMTLDDLQDEIIDGILTSTLTFKAVALAAVSAVITNLVCWELVNRIAIPIILAGLPMVACYVPVALVSAAITLNEWKRPLLLGICVMAQIPKRYEKLHLYVISPLTTVVKYTLFLKGVVAVKITCLSYKVACYVSPDIAKVCETANKSFQKYLKSQMEYLNSQIASFNAGIA